MVIQVSEQKLTRRRDLVSTDMDGETVMMSIDQGEYFGIGGVGTRAWELLENPVSLSEIVATITSEYDIDEATCRNDIKAFLEDLMTNGLIRSC